MGEKKWVLRKCRQFSGRAWLAESVAAIQATKIVQYVFIDLFTDSGTSGTARSPACQTAEQRAADAAKQGADRSSDKANGGSGFSASQCRRGSATSTSDCADSGTGLAGDVTHRNTGRITAGAGQQRVHISACRWVQGKRRCPMHSGWMLDVVI
ncbi:hypothetical protein ACFPTO_18495 [Paraburkholderia denitrificans]|uniref:Uncharacterized protein n=1 Tax=Paraburkholderia denitrificans TaxID=694025 RepID=A0ABW0JC88_9BURK